MANLHDLKQATLKCEHCSKKLKIDDFKSHINEVHSIRERIYKPGRWMSFSTLKNMFKTAITVKMKQPQCEIVRKLYYLERDYFEKVVLDTSVEKQSTTEQEESEF